MRQLLIALLVTTAACSASHPPVAKPNGITFDGAGVIDAAALRSHGDRLTWVLGCKGCHTPNLAGQNFLADDPKYGVLYAPNLTFLVPKYSDTQIDRILRSGVHPVRKQLWIMPSQVFQNLSIADIKALIAYLRSLQPSGTPSPPPLTTQLAKKEFIDTGKVKPAADIVAEYRRKPSADLGSHYALGRYIASVTCAECHGSDLTGIRNVEAGLNAPNLIIAGGYSAAEFERLLTTGVPVGGRKLRLMDEVARDRFSHLTRHERGAIYEYLKARAEQN